MFDMFGLSPLRRSVLVVLLLLLLSSLFCHLRVCMFKVVSGRVVVSYIFYQVSPYYLLRLMVFSWGPRAISP